MEYFENEKSFLYDIKSIFHNFQGLSFDEIRKMADTSWSKKIFAKELTFAELLPYNMKTYQNWRPS